ncbi:hypothetical protein CC1G_10883 [Coprinopsis cinerea okayama7|uniref:Uncharacterized protein n=1 Tax=Coprinopsis cinerea (strain Okayama-7 / 130 / ATCC MYA-4618 / FGSC 9003) TaxID=240176 RepID=A8P5T9_COPC7|nr:hypothetical protein CC1G_10883 [Coprinopsis cinerea okayama7\|eukprot:XP_001839020.2 hypothetical protein CC1G_10883 [Coprinopsis cinerea okayama7\
MDLRQRIIANSRRALKVSLEEANHPKQLAVDYEDGTQEVLYGPRYGSPPRSPTSSVSSATTSSSSCLSHRTSGSGSLLPIFSQLGYTNAILPLDILNIIITRELDGDLPTLKSLSLACRYFCQKTRPLIFRRISLSLHRVAHKIPGHYLMDLFTASRHLLPHIQHVVLGSLFEEDAYCRRDDDPMDFDALRVLLNLQHLTKVTVLGSCNRSWSKVPRNIQKAIRTCLRGKHISQVEVHAMSDFPVYLLEGCRSLKHFSLTGSPSVMTFMVAQDSPSPIHLERLTLRCSSTSLAEMSEWLLSDQCSLDISRLKSLEVQTSGSFTFHRHQDALAQILPRCRNTLEELHLDVFSAGHQYDIHAPSTSGAPVTIVGDDAFEEWENENVPTILETYERLDIGQLRALRRLSLRFGLRDIRDPKRHITLLSGMLKNATNLNRLEDVTIYLLSLDKPDMNNIVQTASSSGSWETLDCALTGESLDPAKHRVALGPARKDQSPHGSHGLCANSRRHSTPPTRPLNRLRSVKLQLADITKADGARLMEICLPRLWKKGVVHVLDKHANTFYLIS